VNIRLYWTMMGHDCPTLMSVTEALLWGKSTQHMAYTLIPEVRWGWHNLLWKVYVVGMCQVWTVVFLLLTMLESLLF